MQWAPKGGAYLFLIGFTSVVVQVVLMRELMVAFQGNELSLGAMLACWLVWTALGSAAAGRLKQPGRRQLAAAFAAAAAGFPLAILLARESRGLLQSARGEVLGFGPMLLTSCAALALFATASGWLFAAGSRQLGADAARSTSSAYLYEAAGAAAGGLAASLALVPFASPFAIAAVVAWLDLLAAASLLGMRLWYRAAAAVLLAATLPSAARHAEGLTLERFWRGFRLVAARNTPYGNLAVVEGEGSRSLAENGLLISTIPDVAAAEEVHFALLAHAAPRTVLLVGGAANGSLTEALKHPGLTRLDYAELDPAIPEMAAALFPAAIPRDPRLKIHALDGRLYLKRTPDRFDVIVIGLPGPQTAQLNRFYTVEFFREARRRLNPGGVLGMGFAASENYISPELARLLASIERTLRAVFPQVVALPGETIHLLASCEPIAADAGTLVRRLSERGIETSYVSRHFLPFRITPERVSALAERIGAAGDAPVNRDLAPVAYYFNTTLWSARFNRGQASLFQALARLPFPVLAVLTGALMILAAAGMRGQPAGLCIGAMGFTMIGLEIMLLVGFQAMHGYVYQEVAVLIAGFMAGMALGSWLALRAEMPARWLAGLQAAAAVAPFAVYGLLQLGAAAIGLAAIGCGFVGGCQFPVASAAWFKGRPRNRGGLYAIDLAGSCLGALLFGAYLIPVFGFLRTAVLMSVVNAAPAAAAALGRRIPAR